MISRFAWLALLLTLLAATCAALLAIGGPLGPASASANTPAHGWDAHCGSQSTPGAGWYHVRAYNVSCHVARRRVAQHYKASGGDEHFNGWTCHDRQTGDEVSSVNCTRELDGRHQHVRFEFGS